VRAARRELAPVSGAGGRRAVDDAGGARALRDRARPRRSGAARTAGRAPNRRRVERARRSRPAAPGPLRPWSVPVERMVRPSRRRTRILLRLLRIGRERAGPGRRDPRRGYARVLRRPPRGRGRARLERTESMTAIPTIEDLAADAQAYIPGPNVEIE